MQGKEWKNVVEMVKIVLKMCIVWCLNVLLVKAVCLLQLHSISAIIKSIGFARLHFFLSLSAFCNSYCSKKMWIVQSWFVVGSLTHSLQNIWKREHRRCSEGKCTDLIIRLLSLEHYEMKNTHRNLQKCIEGTRERQRRVDNNGTLTIWCVPTKLTRCRIPNQKKLEQSLSLTVHVQRT